MRFQPLAALAALTLTALIPASAREPVRARRAMVVAQEPLAADVGAAVLKSGGNAVDAAVAVAFALAVTHPFAGNIGGGGFALIRFAGGHATFIDFREEAPGAASHDMYLDAAGQPTRDSLEGWRAAGVPGTVRGLEMAHQKYGHKPWAELVQPAIDLAAQGFELSYSAAKSLCDASPLLERFPDSKRIFLRLNGRKASGCPEPGDKLVQPELAGTLARIARDGAQDFYAGETAQRLAVAMKANGGLITLEDLKNYRAVERPPLEGAYKGYGILTAPPPSSGGVALLEMLGMLEGTGYEKPGAGSAASAHYLAEVMRRAYADRAEFLGDSDFVHIPVKGLLNPRYLARLRSTIDPARATPSTLIGHGDAPAFEAGATTHFNVIDEQGNAVSLTYTLNGGYGNGVSVPGLGFLLNNEMDDFAAKPGTPNLFGLIQGEANAIAPRKRPLSSMTPAIVTRGDKLYMVLGAPGGARIINGVLQVILNVLDWKMDVQQAVDQPRLHHQWKPDCIYLERGFSPDTIALLRQMGHEVEPDAGAVASVEALRVDGGWIQAAQNGRSNGKAAGY
jgi:gamma-glutamyltranspeptidase/glutathione hydrolase